MKPRLLVVEDEVAILTAMERFLAHQGFEVDTALGREAAERLLAAGAYDAVIADLRMSGSFSTDGLALITFAKERRPATKVILLTAYGSPEIEAEASRLGADAFLHKPLPLAEVADRLRSLLQAS
jgi:DNA-binding response OmpR family regulator